MTWQNTLALDMMLQIDGLCCIYIPSNSSINGSVRRAQQGLLAPSWELAENPGINHPIGDSDLCLETRDSICWLFPCLRRPIASAMSKMFSSGVTVQIMWHEGKGWNI